MGVATSSDGGSGLASPNILSKVSVKGGKADMDAFMTEGRMDNVQIAYVTKKQHERFNPRNINRRVVLTHATLKRVKRNWAMISEIPDNQLGGLNGAVTPLVILYDTFFGRLFDLQPSMRAMFGDNMIRQSKFLVGLVNIIVKMEDMLKQGLSPVYSFADRSVAMGARPEHYEIIASVLPVALEACAEDRAWTSAIAEAWKDVMSFALLVVVERTVESWLSRGTTLSEMWHALADWRVHAKAVSSPASSTQSQPTPDGPTVTRNPLATATNSSIGYNSAVEHPEREGAIDPHQPGVSTDRLPRECSAGKGGENFENSDEKSGEALAFPLPLKLSLPPGDGVVSGGRPHHAWARRISTVSSSTTTVTTALSTAPSGDLEDGHCHSNSNNSCPLSEGERDGLSSNNSLEGVAFGSGGSAGGARKGSVSAGGVGGGGGLQCKGGGGGGGNISDCSRSRSRSRSPTRSHPSLHKPPTPTESLTHFGIRQHGGGADGVVCFAPLVTDVSDPVVTPGTMAVTSVGNDSGFDGSHALVKGTGAVDRGAITGHRSSLHLLRRKKITRSASLEDDDEITQRRRTAVELPGFMRASQDLTSGGGVMFPRGRGRDGSYAFTAGYVRSQSVTDELLPSDRLPSGRFERRMTELDLHRDLVSDRHPRRRGLVSRMRRTASSVIRFRSSSRSQDGSGRGNGHGYRHVHAHQHNAGALSNSSGSQVEGHSYVKDKAPASDGSHSLGVSSTSPVLTAVTPPATTTAIVPMSAAPASGDNPGGVVDDSGVPRIVESVDDTWTSGTSHGNRRSNNVSQRDRTAQRSKSGPLMGENSGEDAAFGYYFSKPEKDGEMRLNVREHHHRRRAHHKYNQNHKHSREERQQGQEQQSFREGDRERLLNDVEDGSGGSEGRGSRSRLPERVNRWRQMKLHELMAKLEDSSAGETERNFCDIAEAILHHLSPSEPPTTRTLALELAQTFVQNILSERSKDKKSSKIRRKAFKELLLHIIPLMLDCLKSAGGSNSRSTTHDAVNVGEVAEPPDALSAAAAAASVAASASNGLGVCKSGGEVVVLHYYQQYLLNVAALETMNRFLTVLRALFRPPQSTRVQKVVAPLLDADEEMLREKAAAVLGKLSLCGKDNLKWANVAIKVSLEAHNLLHDAWPDETVGQIPSSQVESIMGEHPLLPPIHDTFNKGDPEAHVIALGRRFPALCKLLSTLLTIPPPKSNDVHITAEDGGQAKQGEESSLPFQIPVLVSLAISLVHRVLRMGEQAWVILEEERTDVKRDDLCPKQRAKNSAEYENAGTLSPDLAARVSALLLPSAVTLLGALVASPKLEVVMEEHHSAVCQFMGQALAQMPVQGGVRLAAYRSMIMVIRYIPADLVAAELGVPMLPLLFNEALLALGNTVSLHPLSSMSLEREVPPGGSPDHGSAPQVAFSIRTPANNGHGMKLHQDTIMAGVECLATLVLDCGLLLPPPQIAEVERVVTEGVELLAHRPLEVSPFNEDEPQILRHASTREAFVKLVHYYLLLAEEKGRNPGSPLYSEAKLAFHCHLQDPDCAVATECRNALTALKTDRAEQNGGSRREDGGHRDEALEDMEVEADKVHASNPEGNYVLEELDTGEYQVVRYEDKFAKKPSPTRARKADT